MKIADLSIITLAALNERFGRPGYVAFEVSPRGGIVANLTSGESTAIVALHGAHVLSWMPAAGEPDVLWCSPRSRLGTAKPVRGGIPVCWPWFGPHPDASLALPAHGLVRAVPWTVESVEVTAVAVSVTLAIRLDADQQAAVGGNVSAQVRITVGCNLSVELITTNQGHNSVTLTEALHTYFAVGDIEMVSISGLDGRTYLDQLSGREEMQSGPVTIDQETDRIYWDTRAPLLIEDRAAGRSIEVMAEGSASTVIWNPWLDKAVRLGDMPREDYRVLLCTETANIGPRNAVTVAPGGVHRMTCRIATTKS